MSWQKALRNLRLHDELTHEHQPGRQVLEMDWLGMAIADAPARTVGLEMGQQAGVGELATATYLRLGDRARARALTKEQYASPLASRPYDLRLAAVSTWLNGPRSPNGPATASTSCSRSTPSASTARKTSHSSASAPPSDANPRTRPPSRARQASHARSDHHHRPRHQLPRGVRRQGSATIWERIRNNRT